MLEEHVWWGSIYIYIARHELITFLLPVIKFIWERESNTYKFPELMYAFITTDKAGSMETTDFSNNPLEINSSLKMYIKFHNDLGEW